MIRSPSHWLLSIETQAINVTSVFIAVQQAALDVSHLSGFAPRTFIYTVNIRSVTILPSFLDSGMGKFYYGDEQKADGTAKTQGPWLQIFVKGIRSASPDDRYPYRIKTKEPFFWIADTNWELFHKLKGTDVDLYLAGRAGFTFLRPWDSRKNYFTCATNLDVLATD
ncbi:hypothetical protein BGZ61DRAFT_540516 [Ilyonectria robusta]|uniref:uncharacterized protein n=1 Tax=Ilyonectria robusta TaxID=1079257 RepID=UPI001E8D0421|nr:uncharacterized protein BGZ61DRAFT_540516 [Ilyonectria robusta]KAH8658591.1 hypothetical protein BGZ61DRAFT_540516 [Ilyonectria robusta]